MAKRKTIIQVVSRALNLQVEEEQDDKSEKSMPELQRELLAELREAENAVTLSMAQVGHKRMGLKRLVGKHSQLKSAAVMAEQKNRGDLAKKLLGESLRLDQEIGARTDELQAMDLQVQNEMAAFRALERKVDQLKADIQRAGQLEKFNRIRNRVSTVSGEINESVVAQIQERVEKVELESAQIGAKELLKKDASVDADAALAEAEALLANDDLDSAYQLFQAEVKELPEGEGGEPKRIESAADKAARLLDEPAFGGNV